MVRVLSGKARAERERAIASTSDTAEGENGFRVSDAQHTWFGRTVTDDERTRVVDAALPMVVGRLDPDRAAHYLRRDAMRHLNRLLDWLEQFPGVSYQDRWNASEADADPAHWCPEMDLGATRRLGARLSINALILLGVIRPSHEWMIVNKQARFYRDWTALHDAEAWACYFDFAKKDKVPERHLWGTATDMVRICIVNGVKLRDVRREHVLAYRDYLIKSGRPSGDLLTMWAIARGAGLLEGEPAELRELILAQRLTPEQLVDRYGVKAPTVRTVLIAYITEMSTTQDYGSLDSSSRVLVKNFWKPIEDANPGIDTINLTKEQAAQWKASLKTDKQGLTHTYSILGTVRSFYLDIAAWAHEDPATWAQFAVSCPVSIADTRGSTKARKHRTHRFQARTRTLAPLLDTLVVAAEERYRYAVRLREAAEATAPNASFTIDGVNYCRVVKGKSRTTNFYVLKDGETTRLDTEWFITSAFMTWTFIEVLRHTGIRVEEMLELTHLSIRQYRRPDGSIMPLLQIAPSKNDEERIMPCSPELTAALARLIKFVSIDGRVPLCSRRDEHERVMSAPLPFLFQLREAGRSRVAGYGTVRRWLLDLANNIGLKDTDGSPLHFTPHDFRRLFITDIVNAGFPIHLAAKLVGHNSIEVTRGYTAVYQKDVFEAYERFISHRRASRPSAEYREPTQDEWDEFVEHFGRRKVSLGDCHRPYGSDCVHEHACLRCDFLEVDDDQGPRLQIIRDNLQAQVDEAERNLWLGDVDQLRITIQHADQKAGLLERRAAEHPELDVVHPLTDMPAVLPT